MTSSMVGASKSSRVSIEFTICMYFFGMHRRSFSTAALR
jgi:hypothetical protein